MDRHLFLAVLLALFLVFGQTAATGWAAASRLPRLAVPPDQGATQTNNTSPRPDSISKTPQPPFVRLSQMIVNHDYPFNPFTDLDIMAFDPNRADHVSFALATQGALYSPSRDALAPAPGSSAHGKIIAIQRLDVADGPFTPLFGSPFRPLINIWLLPESMVAAIDPGPEFEIETFPPSRSGLNASGRGSGSDPLAYRYVVDKKTSVNAKVGWIQNLSNSTGMRPDLEEPSGDGLSPNKLPGVTLSLGASYRAVTLSGGYIRGLDNRGSADLAATGEESDPVAWNSELAYATKLMDRETILAIGYQHSSEGLHAYLPEKRYRTKASMAISDSAMLSLEYYLDRDEAIKNDEEDGYGIITKIGFGF
ncbi:MAG: hypothetical protein FWG62_09375 [Proteobacteria bacterium]|nr:hypothetical protein [Pseudomonadota bacterium]